MPKLNKISILVDMYDADVIFLYGGNTNDLRKYIKRRHKDSDLLSWGNRFTIDDEDAETTDGYQFHVFCNYGNGEVFYVWVAKPTPYLFAHEIFHLTGDILYIRGLSYSHASEEAYAYLHGWIFDKLVSKLKGGLKC